MTLDELKRLEAAATKGPWYAEHDKDHDDPETTLDLWLIRAGDGVAGDLFSQNNAALIAALRNAAPALIAVAEAAEHYMKVESAKPRSSAHCHGAWLDLKTSLSALSSSGGERLGWNAADQASAVGSSNTEETK